MPEIVTSKIMTQKDADQTKRFDFNDVDASESISGFLTPLVGRKITQTITETTIPGDTAVYAFSENGLALYTITVVYTDATQTTMLYCERTA